MNMEIIEKIPGCTSREGIDLIYELASEAPIPRMLEFGSFVGKSAAIMASSIKDKDIHGTVVCCDRFANNITHWGPGHPSFKNSHKAFWEYISNAGLLDYVVAIKGEINNTINNLSGKFGMIYIDGGHTMKDVLPNALWAWEHIVEGGIILFDDYGHKDYPDIKTCFDIMLKKWDREIYKSSMMKVSVKK